MPEAVAAAIQQIQIIITLILYHGLWVMSNDLGGKEIMTEKCKDCYYKSDNPDVSPCWDCQNGSHYKNYGEGQIEDLARDWRLYQ